jgi:hypothetical protein
MNEQIFCTPNSARLQLEFATDAWTALHKQNRRSELQIAALTLSDCNWETSGQVARELETEISFTTLKKVQHRPRSGLPRKGTEDLPVLLGRSLYSLHRLHLQIVDPKSAANYGLAACVPPLPPIHRSRDIKG